MLCASPRGVQPVFFIFRLIPGFYLFLFLSGDPMPPRGKRNKTPGRGGTGNRGPNTRRLPPLLSLPPLLAGAARASRSVPGFRTLSPHRRRRLPLSRPSRTRRPQLSSLPPLRAPVPPKMGASLSLSGNGSLPYPNLSRAQPVGKNSRRAACLIYHPLRGH